MKTPQKKPTPNNKIPNPRCISSSGWLESDEFQMILYTNHIIAFKYNPVTGEQFVSPFINEYIAGDYNNRYLSDVMLEDGVIHPDDIEKSLQFRQNVKANTLGEIELRLKTPGGQYRWFKMSMISYNNSFIGTFTDIDADIRYKEMLRRRTQRDSVSGIYNRVTFLEKTRQYLKSEPDSMHYLIRFDIERFKLINELYAMAEGDKVLRYIGSLLQSLARPGETYGRMDNDIFCICVKRTRKELIDLLDAIQTKGNEYPLNFQFIFCMGILEIPHYYGESVDILCDHAAIAQRTVKGNYVQRYAFYTRRMSMLIEHEHEITLRMESALENNEFHIYLQPRFDMLTHQIVGAEALVRWIPPGKDPIPPIRFIPLFERNGFILPMDEYVWEEACKTLRSWIDRGLQASPISINISRVHLRDLDFCDKLIRLTEKYKIPPRLLELEITESAYMDCQHFIFPIMQSLQKRGFKFLMDDFGSGYSSLNSLKDIPVNIVKMDMNFLRQSKRGDEIGYNILKGTIRLIQDLELPLVVEGVETEEQEQFLLKHGCYEAQGYYYAKPMPVEEFEKLIT